MHAQDSSYQRQMGTKGGQGTRCPTGVSCFRTQLATLRRRGAGWNRRVKGPHLQTHTYRHTDTETHTHTYRHTNTETHMHRDIDTHRETHRHAHTHRHTQAPGRQAAVPRPESERTPSILRGHTSSGLPLHLQNWSKQNAEPGASLLAQG